MANSTSDNDIGTEAELSRLLLASLRDYAVFATDMQRRVRSWNEGAERIKQSEGNAIYTGFGTIA